MSAWLCTDEHLSYVAQDVAKDLGREDVEELAKEMHAMNVEALVQRYNDKPEGFKPFVFKAGVNPATINHGDYYLWKRGPECPLKQLSCLLYQCSEGDVDQTELYKALSKVRKKREDAYRREHKVDIEQSDAYERGPWGIK